MDIILEKSVIACIFSYCKTFVLFLKKIFLYTSNTTFVSKQTLLTLTLATHFLT